ncbi:MAG: hypothetical protein U0132_06430 [Gemmatimonadaceae bacterium]
MALVSGGDVAIVAIIFGSLSGTVISLAKMRAARLSAANRPSLMGVQVEERLQRIEQAVDAIAIEVERMSESQRFVTKVLAERLPAPGAAALPSRAEHSS